MCKNMENLGSMSECILDGLIERHLKVLNLLWNEKKIRYMIAHKGETIPNRLSDGTPVEFRLRAPEGKGHPAKSTRTKN